MFSSFPHALILGGKGLCPAGSFTSSDPLWKRKIPFSASLAVHGTWDEWSPWSLCSSTCGRGYRDRTRTCKPPQFGGNPCEGPEKQTKFCNIALCPGRDSDRSEISPLQQHSPAQIPSHGSPRSVGDSSASLNHPKEDPEEITHQKTNPEVLSGVVQSQVQVCPV